MKRFAAIFVSGILCGAALMLSTSVFADGSLKQITAYLTPDVSVELDGQKVALQNAPVNYDGSTYLPVRELAGAVGLTIEWDPNSRTAKLNSGKSPAVAEPGSTTPAEGVEDNQNKTLKIGEAYKSDGFSITLEKVSKEFDGGYLFEFSYKNDNSTVYRHHNFAYLSFLETKEQLPGAGGMLIFESSNDVAVFYPPNTSGKLKVKAYCTYNNATYTPTVINLKGDKEVKWDIAGN